MADFSCLKDVKLRPLYLASGDYNSLIFDLNIKPGWKGKVEQFFLQLQSLFAQKTVSYDGLDRYRIEAALLYDTGWYKDAQKIGVVRIGKQKSFIKIYKNYEDLIFNAQQIKFVKEHFSGDFITVNLVSADYPVLLTQFIEKKRSIMFSDHMEERLITIANRLLAQSSLRKNVAEIIPYDFQRLCAMSNTSLAKEISDWQKSHDATANLIPVHGDMTPWNVFIGNDEKVVLVDYERAGWHVGYYDVFHYILQPMALAAKKASLSIVLFNKSWFNHEIMRSNLILYLIDQLYHDLTDFHVKKYQHKHLIRLIDRKFYWLKEALDYEGR